jgi:hypothetical protein
MEAVGSEKRRSRGGGRRWLMEEGERGERKEEMKGEM